MKWTRKGHQGCQMKHLYRSEWGAPPCVRIISYYSLGRGRGTGYFADHRWEGLPTYFRSSFVCPCIFWFLSEYTRYLCFTTLFGPFGPPQGRSSGFRFSFVRSLETRFSRNQVGRFSIFWFLISDFLILEFFTLDFLNLYLLFFDFRLRISVDFLIFAFFWLSISNFLSLDFLIFDFSDFRFFDSWFFGFRFFDFLFSVLSFRFRLSIFRFSSSLLRCVYIFQLQVHGPPKGRSYDFM